MVGLISPGKHSATDEANVTSLGPYALKYRRPTPHLFTISCGHASPPAVNVLKAGRSACGRCAWTEGTRVTSEICISRNRFSSGSPGIFLSRLASHKVATLSSVSNPSRADWSKLKEENGNDSLH